MVPEPPSLYTHTEYPEPASKQSCESCWVFSGGSPTLSCWTGQAQGQGAAQGHAFQEASLWGAPEDIHYGRLGS